MSKKWSFLMLVLGAILGLAGTAAYIRTQHRTSVAEQEETRRHIVEVQLRHVVQQGHMVERSHRFEMDMRSQKEVMVAALHQFAAEILDGIPPREHGVTPVEEVIGRIDIGFAQKSSEMAIDGADQGLTMLSRVRLSTLEIVRITDKSGIRHRVRYELTAPDAEEMQVVANISDPVKFRDMLCEAVVEQVMKEWRVVKVMYGIRTESEP